MRRADIAEAAAAVLAGEGHEGETYALTGPEAFTLAEAAEMITRLDGPRDPLPPRDGRGGLRVAGRVRRPGLALEAWVSTYTSIAAGDLEAVSDDSIAGSRDPGPGTLADILHGRGGTRGDQARIGAPSARAQSQARHIAPSWTRRSSSTTSR